MTTAWASETFEFGGDLVRLTGRGIKEAEYFARVANGCDRVLAEKIFKAMRCRDGEALGGRVFEGGGASSPQGGDGTGRLPAQARRPADGGAC